MAGNVSLQELPRIQVYAPVRVGHEIYQDISCMPRFRGYSVEVCVCVCDVVVISVVALTFAIGTSMVGV